MKQDTSAANLILPIITFFIWGSTYVANKSIGNYLNPILIACLRNCIAIVPLLVLAKQRFPHITVRKNDWKYFFAVGLLGYYMNIILLQISIQLTGASTASLINSLSPITVTICSAIFLKEKVTRLKIVCLILAITGSFIIIHDSKSHNEIYGILIMLLAICFWGLATVSMSRLTSSYPPILITAYGTAFSLLFHIPTGIYTALHNTPIFTWKTILPLLYIGLCGSVVAQITWTASLSRLPASTCSLFYPLQPIFSTILAAIILKESFRSSFFIGLILIILDLILCALENKSVRKNSEDP